MNEANFASLNQSLLARKGGAKPAMRKQSDRAGTAQPLLPKQVEDLGWDDMGDDAVLKTGASNARRSAFSQGKRAAFTLRLDEERHLRLRLAATMKGMSAQKLVTAALDAQLSEIDDLEALATKIANK